MDEKTRTNPRAPYVVKADPLLAPLIPEYLNSRRKDLQKLADALAAKDFGTLRKVGHNMYGSGGAYGLPPVSDVGKRIEDAALASDAAKIGEALEDLRAFLDTVKLPP